MKSIIQILTVFAVMVSFAQEPPSKQICNKTCENMCEHRCEGSSEKSCLRTCKQIKIQKITFITNHLDLSENEAKQFWPLYNRCENNIKNIRINEIMPVRKKIATTNNLSNEEANQLLQQLINAETKIHDTKLTLVSKLKGVISPVKIIKLKTAERRFKKKLLKRFGRERQSKR